MHLNGDGYRYVAVHYVFVTPSSFYLFPVTFMMPAVPDLPKLAVAKLLQGPPEGSSLSPLPFPPGSQVLDVQQRDGVAYVNLNEQASHANVGSAGDTLLVGAIVNTVCGCLGVNKVQLLIEGQVREAIWGHVDTSRPLNPDPGLLFQGFVDLRGHWAERDVLGIALRKGFEGSSDGNIYPDKQVTRAEFVKATVAAKDIKPLATSRVTFVDVPKEHWAHPYVEAAVDSGALKPSDYGQKFVPEKLMRRREAAVILTRAAGLEARARALASTPLPYADTANLPAWARGYIAAAREARLMGGYPDNTFKPEQAMTRAESASALMRLTGSANKAVLVAYPLSGQEAGGEVLVIGVASVFEATVSATIWGHSGERLGGAGATATVAAPDWGVFGLVINRAITPVAVYPVLEVFWESPKDGSYQDITRVPLRAKLG